MAHAVAHKKNLHGQVLRRSWSGESDKKYQELITIGAVFGRRSSNKLRQGRYFINKRLLFSAFHCPSARVTKKGCMPDIHPFQKRKCNLKPPYEKLSTISFHYCKGHDKKDVRYTISIKIKLNHT
jgi:hypothetical protein